MDWLYRRLGLIACNKYDGLRFTWLQVVPSLGLGAKVHLWRRDNDKWQWGLYLHTLFFAAYLKLWWSKRDWPDPDYGGLKWWGFDWKWNKHDHMVFWFGWPNKEHKLYALPWSWQHVTTQHLSKSKGWVVRQQPATLGAPYLLPQDDPDIYVEKLPFIYVLKNGEIQNRVATVTARRTEWRWKISQSMGLPWPKKVAESIDVEFDDEVGESAGSWKGGCVGCSWPWHRGQSFKDALMNMQLTRTFT